ncbi:hypothetical protein GGC64_003090 [Mycobacterium sp. OAS707]|uniref:hypothetical protein n=1 Tax=Mycobacterium sp. OAS707 TaxID=2663822 RepID=UPI00178BC659|nr:hypothetical protein [Mycobacterium sp. OAS707]MBE1549066.1 hypothetical protein [Mycobacterium sp. OAS707]
MGIRWFDRAAALEDLTAAVEGANHGGSLYDTARALVPLALDGADPDAALRVLSAMRPRTWLRLDVELRSLRHIFRPGDEWRQITDAAWAGANSVALLLTACSGDGRQRQRSVQSPLMRSDQRLLPVLLIRTADWAKPVRDDACQALPPALDSADTEGLMRAISVAMVMTDWQRGDVAIAAVTEAMRTRSDGMLDAARISADVRVRRLAYRVWLESSRTDSDAIIAAALTESDIICQRLSVDAAVRAAVRTGRRDALDRLLTSRFARVRVEALAGLVQIGHPEAGEAFLADRSAMLRATAQWAMRRAGRDAAERYRAMLASGDDSVVRAAVAGLGECGTADDAQLVARFIRHARPRIRAEAIRAVRRVGGTLGPVADMLSDSAPVVVRAVADAVIGQPDLAPADRLWELLAADQPAHVRRTAFRLLTARDTWTRIEADLWGVIDFNERLRAHARSDLTGWLDREASTAYQMPPESTRERLYRLIDAAEPNIGTSQARLLRWHLGLSR